MSEQEAAVWIGAYWLLAIVGVTAWCIGSIREARRERALRKRIDQIMGANDE